MLGRCFQRQPPRYCCTNLLQFKGLLQYVFATRKAFPCDHQATIAHSMVCAWYSSARNDCSVPKFLPYMGFTFYCSLKPKLQDPAAVGVPKVVIRLCRAKAIANARFCFVVYDSHTVHFLELSGTSTPWSLP